MSFDQQYFINTHSCHVIWSAVFYQQYFTNTHSCHVIWSAVFYKHAQLPCHLISSILQTRTVAMSFDQQYFINTHSCTVMLVSPVLCKHAQYIAMHVNSAGNIFTQHWHVPPLLTLNRELHITLPWARAWYFVNIHITLWGPLQQHSGNTHSLCWRQQYFPNTHITPLCWRQWCLANAFITP